MKKYFEKYQTTAEYEAASPKWPHVSYIEGTEEVKYEKIDYSERYFATIALGDGTIGFRGSYSGSSTSTANKLSYSTDNGSTWTTMTAQTVSVQVSNGQKVLWKGSTRPYVGGIGTFSATANFKVEGNAMSLLFGNSFKGKTSLSGKNYAFRTLFHGNRYILSAKNLVLPATTLSEHCYESMFNSCSNLTDVPALPATTLATSCYQEMCSGCRSLTKAPVLPARTLVNSCYLYSFLNCTNLYEITCLATDISASNCTTRWVDGVASTGTFTKAASMTSWTTGTAGIPDGWTVADA